MPDSAMPGGQVCGARQYLSNRESPLRGRPTMRVIPLGGTCSEENFLSVVRLAVYDTRQVVWELAAPSGTCPPPGDLYCCSLEF